MIFSGALLVAGCVTLDPGPSPLTDAEIVQFSRSGESPTAIIDRLKKTDTMLWLSASDIVQLRQAGVAPEVLDYLQAAQIAETRRRSQFDQLLYGPEMSPNNRPSCPRSPIMRANSSKLGTRCPNSRGCRTLPMFGLMRIPLGVSPIPTRCAWASQTNFGSMPSQAPLTRSCSSKRRGNGPRHGFQTPCSGQRRHAASAPAPTSAERIKLRRPAVRPASS